MSHTDRRTLDRTLWAAQWILAGVFAISGMMKLGLSIHHARTLFGTGRDTTTGTLHTIGMIEAIVAMAVVLPGVTRVLPSLCAVAAAVLGGIALFGTLAPASAAGTGFAGVNAVLFALGVFVVLGRLAKAPIAPFTDEIPLI